MANEEPAVDGPKAPGLKARLRAIHVLNDEILETARETFSGVKQMYAADLLVFGALNRLLSNGLGFKLMIESKLFPCAAALLRMQIDVALRVFALTLTDNADSLAKSVMDGIPISRLKCRNGKKLTDTYLVERISSEADWVPDVYKETSSFIHLSNRHISGAMRQITDAGKVELAITGVDRPVPEEEYYEIVEGFFEATKLAGVHCLAYLTYRSTSQN